MSAGLVINVFDVGGRKIGPVFFYDAILPPPNAGDSAAFIKLNPDHSFGMRLREKVSNLVAEPGVYFLEAEYHSPIPESYARRLKNVWGISKPVIRSARFRIEVR